MEQWAQGGIWCVEWTGGQQQAAAARLMSGWAGGLLMPEGAQRVPGARCWPVQARVFNNSSCCSGLVKYQTPGHCESGILN